MFLQAPSGLVLYWFVSNLWTIGQQIITNRLIGPPNVRTLRPPAERRLKKAGAGKTEAAGKSE
jgi:membrane protein insertase Oxa1/YidC/SpoIIIJ